MNPRGNFFKVFVLFLTLTVVGAGCGGPSEAERLANKSVTLEIWRVFDESNTFSSIMSAYQALHPNVSFSYKELRFDEYEDELIRAFAEGKGPDIFSLHNTWIGGYESLIEPMPDSVSIPFVEVRGSIKKEVVYTLEEKPTTSMRALKSDYVDVVVDDVVRRHRANDVDEPEDRIFGLPMAVDTMAMYYNIDLLNAAGIPEPPTDWTRFQEDVSKLTKVGPNDTILQAGVAMGTADNVERASDLVSLLMMQNGVDVIDERGFARFAYGEDEEVELAMDAVRFYTDFANPLKQVYSWNEFQPNSFDAFLAGNAAFFFGYSYHAPLLKATSPKLHFSIAPMPQIDGGKNVNYANYWVETVAKSTDNLDWAWDFILFATGKDQVTKYLDVAKKPTARRGLINSQIEDENLSSFVSQTLTAESWYRGKKASVAEDAMNELIEASLSGEELETAIGLAQNKINQTF